MKRTFLLFVVFCFVTLLSAQSKFKFGTCPIELLKMENYEKDPDASALVVYENADVYYNVNSVTFDFEIVTEYVVRIKIFTQGGIDFAEGVIPFYKGRTKALSEDVKGLTGWTYNLEGDKVIKDKLSKDYIFTEDITENSKRLKFALPAVKAGSVVEYKYTLSSPYYYSPEDFVFQRTIPVQYSLFTIKIPEYFKFNKEVRGYETIHVSPSKQISLSFSFKSSILRCSGEEISAEVHDLPALKDENYVWNYNDFKSGINFEIRSVDIPGVYYKNFSQTWSNVVKELNEYDFFGKQFNNKSLFKDDLPSVLAGKTTDMDSLRAILHLVRSKIKWNNRSKLAVDNQSKALKEGVGSSAEINALLINALRNAGFTAYPVALSLRSRGRIPITYPSLNNLNYFIACVYRGQKVYYLDGTRSYTDINVIPVDCMADKALIVSSNGFDWVDLSTIGNNINRINLLLRFNEDGILEGSRMENHFGEEAYVFKQNYNKSKDEKAYIESLESKNNIVISDYKLEEKTHPNFGFSETYHFLMNDIRLGDDIISFNPLLFLAMKNNAFKAEIRKLPVEFPYPFEQRINVTIMLPEEYTVDEIPASAKFVYKDGIIDFSYITQQNNNNIQLIYRVNLNTSIIPVSEYGILRDFWSKIYNKENELITIKKN